MQPIRRLLAKAMLRASGRGGWSGGNTRQRAVKLCASACLMLLLCPGGPPAAAQGICSPDNPHVTHFSLVSKSGYELRFTVRLQGDKIGGTMHANAVGKGPDGENYGAVTGTVDGQIYPGNRMFIQVFLAPPAEAGSKVLIAGSLHEGGGHGDLRDTTWGADIPDKDWILKTPDGCPKWPEDALRSDLAKAAEAHADQAAPALAAANPLHACRADSWSLSSSTASLGNDFMSGCVKEAAKALPWPDTGQPPGPANRLMATGPGSMPWKACEAALNKRVDGLIEAAKPSCDKAKRLMAAKNSCVPVQTTLDGKSYQNPRPFTDAGKDIQSCMNAVQGCFDRNAEKEAQDSCASRVLGCFDTGGDTRVAAVKLFGAGRGGKSGTNVFCLSIRSDSDARSTFMPHGKDWSIFVGSSSSGDAVGNAYADIASLVLRCRAPKLAAMSPILTRRPVANLSFADRLVLNVPAKGGTIRLASLDAGDWCLPTTSPTAKIPVIKLPSDGRPPKVTNRGTSKGSSGVTLAAPGRVSGCSSAMDRLSGDCAGGGGASPSSRLPDTSRGGIRQGGTASTGSSGIPTARPITSPQGSSGVSMPAGGPAVQGTIRMNRPSSIDTIKQQPPRPSDAYRYRVN
jgi:hypothetical protein